MAPATDLSLKDLSLKLVMLLALTSGQLCQTLACLDLQNMKKTENYYVVYLTAHLKQNWPGNTHSTFYVRKYQQPDLCVYRSLAVYLDRTLALRNGVFTKLLFSYAKPHGPVGTNTISRWIKQVLTLIGVDTTVFTAHSTRPANVSKAKTLVPVDTILKHVGWSSDSVF